MTSYDFEKAAKNAVRKEFAKGGINFTISDIDFVWIAHELGYKKCTIWGAPMGNKYAEVTYNSTNRPYMALRNQKIMNVKVPASAFDFSA